MVEPWVEIGPLINRALWLARRSLAPAAAGRKLTVAQAVTLVALVRAEEEDTVLTPASLAERLGIERSAVSVVLARLVRARWVATVTVEADHRSRTLSLTQSGRALASEMDARIREVWRRSLGDATPEEVERFVQTLRSMREALEAGVGMD